MLKLRDIMTTDVLTVSPETTLREAMELLARRHVSGAPVVAGGKLVGVITATDLMALAAALSGVPTEQDAKGEIDDWAESWSEPEIAEEAEPQGTFFSELWDDAGADVTERIASVRTPEWNVLEEHDVSEAMTRAPLATLTPDDRLEAAAELMVSRGIHRVLVTEGGQLVGIVSALDIARAAAQHVRPRHDAR